MNAKTAKRINHFAVAQGVSPKEIKRAWRRMRPEVRRAIREAMAKKEPPQA